jgi:RNA polymerase sigma-70 factor (ECF subfamily)
MEQEQRCIEAALEGDHNAFGDLVRTYERPVYNLAYRMLGDTGEAEDAAQEVFLRAYRKLNTYDPQRKFSTWLLSIASHYCIDRLRRRRLQWFSLEDEKLPADTWTSDLPGPERQTLEAEGRAEIQELLETLPEDYRAAVVLHYWYELSYEEIAEVTESTVSAIKSRLFRARRMLGERLQQSESGAGAVVLAY